MNKLDNRISARLTPELLTKVELWKTYGYHASDIVRHALAVLPTSPQEISRTQFALRIKPLPNRCLQVELKDEKAALKSLQEW